MVLVNPKMILVFGLLLLVLYVGMITASTTTQVLNIDDPSLIRNTTVSEVDRNICSKIQEKLSTHDPCKWIIDRSQNIIKIVVGGEVAAKIEYVKYRWNEIDAQIRLAIANNVPQEMGKDVVNAFVEVDSRLKNIGIGSYLLSSGDSLIKSGTARLVMDMAGWIERGKNIPVNSVPLMNKIYFFITGQ